MFAYNYQILTNDLQNRSPLNIRKLSNTSPTNLKITLEK